MSSSIDDAAWGEALVAPDLLEVVRQSADPAATSEGLVVTVDGATGARTGPSTRGLLTAALVIVLSVAAVAVLAYAIAKGS
ncbi:MAG TPA: hypothetical protein VNE21_07095 [Mycobacteriales bacterium]|nr:hypothetical protein [Mycobacteriales bacterium]